MGRLKNIGIEKIRVYPTSLKLDLSTLAKKRGYDVHYMHRELMVKERGINPVWEDALTMAVNAAKPMLTEEDIQSIGLFIVGTETGLDQEKSLSSWAHAYLGLPSACRHFEIKGACYSGTAALKMATSWLASGMAKPGQKALVITTDQSLNALHLPWEYVGGAAAVAMLISCEAHFLTFESEKFGIYAREVSDVIRPLPWIETGNSEDSLFSYMEGLTGAYDDYVENVGTIRFERYFDYNIYHVPFSGISFRAHKQLMCLNEDHSKEEVLASFREKTQPSLCYTSKIGSSYGGSTFIALLSLIHHTENSKKGDRIGIFSYGSGSCAEFYSAKITEKSKAVAEKAGLDQLLAERQNIAVSDYETQENLRVEMSKSMDFTPDLNLIEGLYERHYKGKGKLILKKINGYYRHYEFS